MLGKMKLDRISHWAAIQMYVKGCRAIPELVQFAELHLSKGWIDLCFWNGTAWQYVRTRRDG